MNDFIFGMEKHEFDRVNAPRIYKMIALRGMVIFPHALVLLEVARDKSLVAINKAFEVGEDIFVVAQKHAATTMPSPKDIHRAGTICRIKRVERVSNDIVRAMVQGVARAEIDSYMSVNPAFEVTLKTPEITDNKISSASEAYIRSIKDAAADYTHLDSKLPQEISQINIEDDPERYAYVFGQYLLRKEDERQRFLSASTPEQRLDMLLLAIIREAEILKVEKKISAKVRKQIDKNQKDYYLREQVRAIHEELGDGEEELDEYLAKAKKLKLPKEALEKIEKEVRRLGKMSPTSPEASVSRSYIEWILDVPWEKTSSDNTDLGLARDILNEDHYGLEKVKERILEYLAVLQLTGSTRGPILCFVGPPGVGKTSIVRSIARTLSREFVSMSLGGVKDEAEIRGHRRTYIGAIPGRIIYHMKQAGTINPVFLLDEIDKMSSDYRGDPASAMLEVLDPEQNFHYRDHYLEIPYDLSKALFVTTANGVETIPAPLLDRMEIIELSGYTDAEKVQIARKYLLPKQLAAHGLSKTEVVIADEVLTLIAETYTRESGVRSLEREIANICRKIALRIIEKQTDANRIEIGAGELSDYLGVPKYSVSIMNDADEVGLSTGLAWTAVGGKTMNIEVTLLPGGKGEIQLTGQLGDIMKESARTAISLIHSRADKYNIDAARFATTDIHLHVPEGAVPKDGPSAGTAIATAILSAFTDRAVSRTVAMTGEVTLRGRVLPIGGLKEKMLAAYRAGIQTILIPNDNVKDLEEIPANIRGGMRIIPMSSIDTAFETALTSYRQ
ncbi:MAG: endopeptidase La [Clostridiales bacterium]|nr:endopeptidase La [Clostridiales bacterium]